MDDAYISPADFSTIYFESKVSVSGIKTKWEALCDLVVKHNGKFIYDAEGRWTGVRFKTTEDRLMFLLSWA